MAADKKESKPQVTENWEAILYSPERVNKWLHGEISLRELNAVTGLSIPKQSYDTVGGWVLDLFGRVPRATERMVLPSLTVTVEKVERTRVVEVLVALHKPVAREAAA